MRRFLSSRYRIVLPLAIILLPRNYAVAINDLCLRCETFAAAFQYVITTDGLVRFSPEGQQRLADLQQQIRELAATDGIEFSELKAQIKRRVTQMWAVVDDELVKVGATGVTTAYEDSDQALADGSGSPTASPTPSDGEPTAISSESPTPDRTPTGGSPTSPLRKCHPRQLPVRQRRPLPHRHRHDTRDLPAAFSSVLDGNGSVKGK